MRLTRPVAILAVLAAGSLAASSALAAGGPAGTYKTRIGAKELGGQLRGTWTITFRRGAYTVRDNGKPAVRGRYALKGHRITLADKSGPAACRPKGVYTYRLSGKHLTFKRVSDSSPSCTGRAHVLAHRFTKV